MKNFFLLSVLFTTLLSCNSDVETEEVFDTNSFTKLSLDNDIFKEENLQIKKGKSSLYYIYKKSIWIKKGYAIMFSPKEKKILVYNPKIYSVLLLDGRLTVWTEFFNTSCNCKESELCVNGVCQSGVSDEGLPEPPCGGGCAPGSICVQGNCQVIEEPCGGACPQGTFCVNGACEPTQTGSCEDCKPGELCVNGQCIADPCEDCDADEICIQGNCSDFEDQDELEQLLFF